MKEKKSFKSALEYLAIKTFGTALKVSNFSNSFIHIFEYVGI